MLRTYEWTSTSLLNPPRDRRPRKHAAESGCGRMPHHKPETGLRRVLHQAALRRLPAIRPRVPELVVRIRAPRVQPMELLAPHADDSVLDEPDRGDLVGQDFLD